ncbi:30S ribosomal protein S27ae [Halobacteriales archaeon SW_7_68_16]|nr:MAG: 30S ribosomal protein S27ae [Halobacteriales archaeon SW_7_68_16]
MTHHDLYADDGTTDRERCPRCGDSFMADHGDRLHCGACGHTEWD